MADRKWHSVNIISTLVAILAVCFAGLQWHTAEQQRLDTRMMHETQMRQAGERLRDLAADYQAALAKRDLAYATSLKELEANNRAMAAELQEKERLISVLSHERAATGTSASRDAAPPPKPVPEPISPVLRAKTEILGKWRSTRFKSHTVEFFVDGSLVETTAARIINGNYTFIDNRRLRWRAPGLFWGENVVVFEFAFGVDRLTLTAPNGLTSEYVRLAR